MQKYNKYLSIRILIVFWYIITFLFQISFHTSPAIAKENTVIIIQSQQIVAYNEAVKGFQEGCKGKNISIRATYNLNGDAEEGKRIIQNIKGKKSKPDLILAVGILAATIVKDQFTNIPIIFCMVINHERFNLQGVNVTGISSEASVEDQFAVLKEFFGAHKNIGVIYDPTKTGKIISEATHIAKKFEFNLITKEVDSENKATSVLNTIIRKIDILWIIPDGTVITKNSLDTILKGTLKYNLPTFCTSSAIVKAGALMSVSTDYTHTGIQASEIAQTLLNSPKTTSLGVQQPEKLTLTLNTQTADMLGINLSSIQSRSDVVLYP